MDPLDGLPGAAIIRKGIEDLERGALTEAALLVAIGAPRLRRIGLRVPECPVESPERALYEALSRSDTDSAHSRYNALVRLLVSFERAAECAIRPT